MIKLCLDADEMRLTVLTLEIQENVDAIHRFTLHLAEEAELLDSASALK